MVEDQSGDLDFSQLKIASLLNHFVKPAVLSACAPYKLSDNSIIVCTGTLLSVNEYEHHISRSQL